MKIILLSDISGKYGLLYKGLDKGFYQVDDNNYIFVINKLYILLTKEEFNNIPKYYRVYSYNCYNKKLFQSERFRLNQNIIKFCYWSFVSDRCNDIFNIKEFKRLMDILYNTIDFDKNIIDIMWENNISKTVERYIFDYIRNYIWI